MAEAPPPKTMLIAALLLAAGGVGLGWAAWTSSPRLHVPPNLGFVLAAALMTTAVMVVFQVFGVWRWNDLLAAVVLLGVTIELAWLALGSGTRLCAWGGWPMPEPVCRGVSGGVALICGAMTLWAVRRYARSR
jgi:hypothetical protein